MNVNYVFFLFVRFIIGSICPDDVLGLRWILNELFICNEVRMNVFIFIVRKVGNCIKIRSLGGSSGFVMKRSSLNGFRCIISCYGSKFSNYQD